MEIAGMLRSILMAVSYGSLFVMISFKMVA